MQFKEAYELMRQGIKVRLPEWEGYWRWDLSSETIMIHCRDGVVLDIRETDDVNYTISFTFRDDWEVVVEPGDEMSFGEALELLEHSQRVRRKSWQDGVFIELQRPDEHSKMTLPYIYLCTEEESRIPWTSSQVDMLSKDWLMYKSI